MVKDEIDVIETTIRHMLGQVDYVIVADNMSTDGTLGVLQKLENSHKQLLVMLDTDPAYYQSIKMTKLAHKAHKILGADWIVPFDADEIWQSSFAPRIADRLDLLGEQWLVVEASLYDYVATGSDNAGEPNPMRRIQWRTEDPIRLPKVACRWREDLVIDHGNHRALYDGSGATISHDRFVVRHFPWRSPEQFITKVRNGYDAYQAAEDLRDNDEIGGHWKGYGKHLNTGGEQYVVDNIYRRFFWADDPHRVPSDARQLVHDPVVW
jgi:glycosyltransferase involved in cell wall biosynthesis